MGHDPFEITQLPTEAVREEAKRRHPASGRRLKSEDVAVMSDKEVDANYQKYLNDDSLYEETAGLPIAYKRGWLATYLQSSEGGKH